jgi:hypothetical protein
MPRRCCSAPIRGCSSVATRPLLAPRLARKRQAAVTAGRGFGAGFKPRARAIRRFAFEVLPRFSACG